MLAELKRAYAKKEPIAVILWSPHWAYSEYDLTKLKDPQEGLRRGQQPIHTIANKSFPEAVPAAHEWLKNFKMSEGELGSLENEIQKRGQGHEEEAVAAWLKEHPGIVERMTPQ